MRVIHLQMDAVRSGFDIPFLELVLRMQDGVRKVASLTSLGLVSVMFDEAVTDPGTVQEAVQLAGFDTREYQPAAA